MTFISYSRKDAEFALKLAIGLREAGHLLWLDQLDIAPGEMWDQAVEAALSRSTELLIILSPDSVSSRTVMDEVSFALEENKRILPVIHRSCSVPFRLRRLQHIDFTKDYPSAFRKLSASLRPELPKSQIPPSARWAGRAEEPGESEKVFKFWLDAEPHESEIGSTVRGVVVPSTAARVWLGLILGLVGAVLGGLASWIESIYPSWYRAFVVASIEAVPWFGAGFIAGNRRNVVLWTFAGATAAAFLGAVLAGWGKDSVLVGSILGAFGALVGAWVGTVSAKPGLSDRSTP